MHELRAALPEDKNAFKDTWDEFDFADLVVNDPQWAHLYNDDCESIEELEANELERMTLGFIEAPEFTDHVIGYTYYREVYDIWPSLSGLGERILPYKFARPPESVRRAVAQTVRTLVETEILQTSANTGIFTSGPKMPRDEFFCAIGEDFEDQVIDFLRKSGGASVGKHILFRIFGDDIDPYEFWAGQRKLIDMLKADQVVREHGQIRLIRPESPWSNAMHTAIESVFEFDNPPEDHALTRDQLEHRMRRLGYAGTQRMVKPKQRGMRRD